MDRNYLKNKMNTDEKIHANENKWSKCVEQNEYL